MTAVTVSRSGDRLIAVKQVPPARAAQADREARTLERVDHPGVVRLIKVTDAEDGGRHVHTLFVSSDTWATRPLVNPTDRAAAVAALAAVLADLHDMGVTHGNLRACHVLHAEGDRPVLCSFGNAGDDSAENVRADLDALADLMHDEDLGSQAPAQKLKSLAAATRAGHLSARQLASRVDLLLKRRDRRSQLIRRRKVWRKGSGADNTTKRHSGLSWGLLVAGAVGVVVGGVAVAARLTSGPQQGPSPAEAASAQLGQFGEGQQPASPAGGADHTLGTQQTSATGAAGRAAATGSAGASGVQTTPQAVGDPVAAGVEWGASDPGGGGSSSGSEPQVNDSGRFEASASARPGNSLDGTVAGTGSQATTAAGAILEHAGRRYAIGASGDIVLTGDWDCAGEPTPAIVRPTSGAVVVFDTWPAPGESISMPVRWRVDSPLDALTETHGGCDLIRVHTATGSRLLDPLSG